MGNALDRGVGYTPYGEHTKNICGLEVVLANGEVVRTGMGAFSNAPTWQAYPFGFGPGWDQMFVQSNFGIVTKMGMWLMPEPESLMGMDVEFDRPEDLKVMVDTHRAAAARADAHAIPQHRQLDARRRRADHARPVDRSARRDFGHVIDAIRRQFNIGWWGVSLRLYGREDVNRAAYRVLNDAIGAAGPIVGPPTNGVRGQPMEYTGWTGTPMTFPMQNVNWYGGRGGHIGFSVRSSRRMVTPRWRSSAALMPAIRNTAWIIRAALPLANGT